MAIGGASGDFAGPPVPAHLQEVASAAGHPMHGNINHWRHALKAAHGWLLEGVDEKRREKIEQLEQERQRVVTEHLGLGLPIDEALAEPFVFEPLFRSKGRRAANKSPA